jgi:dTDP-4-dehydrorhamnose reductase
MKILVLGHTGMLGNCVHKYFSSFENIKTFTVDGRWPDDNFLTQIANADDLKQVDYVINCIGAIPQRTEDFDINYELPIWLDKNLECRVVHPGTDCEMDNDHYGVSKVNASDYIKIDGMRTKIIKTSIIGHELNSSNSLLDWFLNTEGSVSGYTQAMWNGNTTLEWANACLQLMNDWDLWETETIIKSHCISKFELLQEIANVYEINTEIKLDASVIADKCLVSGKQRNPITIQLKELKEFYGY